MKATYVKKLWTKYLAIENPSLVCMGHLVLKPPVKWFIRGFVFDSSGFSASACYLQAFSMMVTPPSDGIAYQFGDRIGSYEFLPETEALVMPQIQHAIQTRGMPIINHFSELGSLKEFASGIEKGPDAVKMEVLAHSYILTGHTDKARPVLSNVAKISDAAFNQFPQATWDADRSARAHKLLALLDNNTASAVDLLKDWRMETLRSLKLERFAGEV